MICMLTNGQKGGDIIFFRKKTYFHAMSHLGGLLFTHQLIYCRLFEFTLLAYEVYYDKALNSSQKAHLHMTYQLESPLTAAEYYFF